MSYSIIEFYLSNIPIFVSSFEVLKKNKSFYSKNFKKFIYLKNIF